MRAEIEVEYGIMVSVGKKREVFKDRKSVPNFAIDLK